MTEDEVKVDELIAVREELNVPKKHRNDFGEFDYRTMEDILEAAKPICAEYGCILMINDDIKIIGKKLPVTTGTRQGQKGEEDYVMDGPRVYVKTTATFGYPDGRTITATGFAREPMDKKGMDEMQVTGAAASYAGKRALGNLFLLDDNKDADSLPAADEDQIAQFLDWVENEDKFSLYMLKQKDFPLFQSLLRTAPAKGELTHYKRVVNDLAFKAYEDASVHAKALIEATKRKDLDGIKEITDELSGNIKEAVWIQLPESVQIAMRKLLETS